MEQTKREKIALIVFAVLVVGVIAGGITYINVGHNWNVAATTIDDATGTLDGYTAIVYDGVTMPTLAESDANLAPVTLTSVVKSYQSKKATTFTLDLVNMKKYDEGMIVKKGTKRIGVFSMTTRLSDSQLKARIKYFKDCKVDYVVCITTKSSFIYGRNQGVDLVVLTTKEKPDTNTSSTTSSTSTSTTASTKSSSTGSAAGIATSTSTAAPSAVGENAATSVSADASTAVSAESKAEGAQDASAGTSASISTSTSAGVSTTTSTSTSSSTSKSTSTEVVVTSGKTIDGTFYVVSPSVGKIGTVLISAQGIRSSKDISRL